MTQTSRKPIQSVEGGGPIGIMLDKNVARQSFTDFLTKVEVDLAKTPLVVLVWEDSYAMNRGWEDRSDLDYTGTTVVSVGFILEDGPWVLLAQSLTPEQAGHVLRVPKGMVKQVIFLDTTTVMERT